MAIPGLNRAKKQDGQRVILKSGKVDEPCLIENLSTTTNRQLRGMYNKHRVNLPVQKCRDIPNTWEVI